MKVVLCVSLMLNCPCSASLYVVKVLRGAPPADNKEEQAADGAAASDVCSHTLIDLIVETTFKQAFLQLYPKQVTHRSGQALLLLSGHKVGQ